MDQPGRGPRSEREAETALLGSRTSDCELAVGWALVDHLRNAVRERHRPAVFRRAREVFARVTRSDAKAAVGTLDELPELVTRIDGGPAVLIIGLVTKRSVTLGIEGGNLPLLLLTLAVSVVTFGSGRTSVLQGCIHLLLFAVFFLLIFAP